MMICLTESRNLRYNITYMSFGPIRRLNILCITSHTHLSEHRTSFQAICWYVNFINCSCKNLHCKLLTVIFYAIVPQISSRLPCTWQRGADRVLQGYKSPSVTKLYILVLYVTNSCNVPECCLMFISTEFSVL